MSPAQQEAALTGSSETTAKTRSFNTEEEYLKWLRSKHNV